MDAKQEKRIYKQLVKNCNKLGWDIAIGTGPNEDETVIGLIIGTKDYVEAVIDKLERCQEKEKKSKKKRK